jgi:hypothetical protein
MKKRAFFDVDGTLIDKDDVPRPLIPVLFKALTDRDCSIIVWSGGGRDYAKRQAQKILGVDEYVLDYDAKFNFKRFNINEHDFCVDDEEFVCRYFVKEGSTAFWVPFYDSKLDDIESHAVLYRVFDVLMQKIGGFVDMR